MDARGSAMPRRIEQAGWRPLQQFDVPDAWLVVCRGVSGEKRWNLQLLRRGPRRVGCLFWTLACSHPTHGFCDLSLKAKSMPLAASMPNSSLPSASLHTGCFVVVIVFEKCRGCLMSAGDGGRPILLLQSLDSLATIVVST